ncbi:unnamed protein product, partial [Rotaria sp. Silwood2]
YISCDPKYTVSQWTMCKEETKAMSVDREYCRQLDPYGTPIGVPYGSNCRQYSRSTDIAFVSSLHIVH